MTRLLTTLPVLLASVAIVETATGNPKHGGHPPGGHPPGGGLPIPAGPHGAGGYHPGGNPVGWGHMGGSPGGWHTSRPYHQTYGRAFSHGFFYQGRGHRHWTHVRWWGKYRCRCYWCPSTSCWYYWCESAGCYYPVSYATVTLPTEEEEGVPLTLPSATDPPPLPD